MLCCTAALTLRQTACGAALELSSQPSIHRQSQTIVGSAYVAAVTAVAAVRFIAPAILSIDIRSERRDRTTRRVSIASILICNRFERQTHRKSPFSTARATPPFPERSLERRVGFAGGAKRAFLKSRQCPVIQVFGLWGESILKNRNQFISQLQRTTELI